MIPSTSAPYAPPRRSHRGDADVLAAALPAWPDDDDGARPDRQTVIMAVFCLLLYALAALLLATPGRGERSALATSRPTRAAATALEATDVQPTVIYLVSTEARRAEVIAMELVATEILQRDYPGITARNSEVIVVSAADDYAAALQGLEERASVRDFVVIDLRDAR